jgi:hypothetical protein
MHCSRLVKIMLLIMYLWGAHTLTAVVHLCINISLCLFDTVRRQQVYAVQHNRHAECREWWTSLFAGNIWHTSVCSVARKDGAVEGPLPLYASVPNAVLCILHGNIHKNIRFPIMDTVTTLAFTVFSHTVRYLVNWLLPQNCYSVFQISSIIIVRFIFVALKMQEFQYME